MSTDSLCAHPEDDQCPKDVTDQRLPTVQSIRVFYLMSSDNKCTRPVQWCLARHRSIERVLGGVEEIETNIYIYSSCAVCKTIVTTSYEIPRGRFSRKDQWCFPGEERAWDEVIVCESEGLKEDW